MFLIFMGLFVYTKSHHLKPGAMSFHSVIQCFQCEFYVFSEGAEVVLGDACLMFACLFVIEV